MAHQSGIGVSDKLTARFRDAHSEPVRVVQAQIVGESVELTTTVPQQGGFIDDLAQVPAMLSSTEPSYLLVRLDSDKWLFATYVPDAAPVRSKMLYAATKATVAKALGDSYFAEDMFGTTPSDFSPEGYRLYKAHEDSSAPLTERELEMERIRDLESHAASAPSIDSRRSHVASAQYPLDPNAEAALRDFARGTINFVLLAIDAASEVVVASRAESLQSHAELAACIPKDLPSYVLYWFDSSTTLFIYSCPTASSVRNRMVYSTFRHGLIVTATQMGINVHIRLELDDPQEITPDWLEEEVRSRAQPEPGAAAAASATKPKFKRPMPPNRRPRTCAPGT
ncbi:Twinfilin-1 [Coemansia brasiliensis]|uniref:Twinfilin-1 n=1 Tax=Coemansia brasiliensis TaxID=2650707 RepID=A0A9W8LY01_9FUNG|nr:Twinfilin-1 [Coemansia brasiliensis]